MQGNLKENIDHVVENSVNVPEIKLIQKEETSSVTIIDNTSL